MFARLQLDLDLALSDLLLYGPEICLAIAAVVSFGSLLEHWCFSRNRREAKKPSPPEERPLSKPEPLAEGEKVQRHPNAPAAGVVRPSFGKPRKGRSHGLAKSGNRRGSLRRGGNRVPVLIARSEGASEHADGEVLDRSMHGLCLTGTESVPVGTFLRVRCKQYGEEAPWVEVEVRNCRPRDGRFLLGCRFTQPQLLSVLLLFG
jgi:hypothetical protein